jgi:hypothetical protein
MTFNKMCHRNNEETKKLGNEGGSYLPDNITNQFLLACRLTKVMVMNIDRNIMTS